MRCRFLKRKIVGTCAGTILLAKDVIPNQRSLSLIDISVERNAYGRQIDSFVGESDESGQPLVFIRAPQISRVGLGVSVLLHCNKEPVLVSQRNIMAATFHPELSSYQYVIDFCHKIS